ncbi:type II secretion system protein GspM [Emcibacter sp.]|uniref:type II secretion system protein GspM n=1 Tax=Emcibacter sp. TaxID=1979954 RepID=UPI002AA86347|nr:type II secretion system protein GspM [Emcibacter sp.]
MMWFMHLSRRERALVVGAAFLGVLVFGWLAIWSPVTGYHQDEKRNYIRAAGDYDFVRQSLARMPVLTEQSQEQAGDEEISLRVAAGQTARSMGLAITRLQPGEKDTLTLWFDSADGGLLFQWLARIGQRYGIQVKNIAVNKNEGQGTVRAQVTLGRSGA